MNSKESDEGEAKQLNNEAQDAKAQLSGESDQGECSSVTSPLHARAVDMTGSINPPTAVSPSKAVLSSKTKGSKGNQDEALNKTKPRFRYSANAGDDEWEGSDGDSSRQSDDDITSRELTMQQIHDQRVKLASKEASESITSRHQPAHARPPASHQLSSSSEKGHENSSNAAVVPGAFSVDGSRSNISVEDSAFSTNDPNAMVDTNTEMETPAMMQLEAIPVDEDVEHARMREMEDQMNREIQRRLSLERRMAETEQNNDPSNKNNGPRANCSKERIPIIMASLMLLSALLVGVYFLIGPNETRDVEPPSTNSFFVYPPPSDQECFAIASSEAVPNQENYYSLTMANTMDVSYDDAVASVNDVLLEVFQMYKREIPILVGCEGDVFNQEYFNRTFTADRYKVANAQVLATKRSTVECDAGAPLPCLRVTAEYMLWLKSPTSPLDMITFMQSNFGPILFQGLYGEESIIFEMKMVSLGSPQQDGTRNTDYLYPPPTVDECEAMENGVAIPSQDSYSRVTMAHTLDVSYNGEEVDWLLVGIAEAYDEIILPALVGCYDQDGYFNNTLFTENRYLAANAQIASVERSNLDCGSAQPSPCIRVTVNFVVWTKAEASFADMIKLVQANFGSMLLEGLKKDGVIYQYKLVSVGEGDRSDHDEPGLLYPPPTEEECTAILNGDAVPNQDQYLTQTADATMDIPFALGDQLMDDLLSEIRDRVESTSVTMAGCDSIGKEIYSTSPVETRYIVANMHIIDVTRSDLECRSGSPQPCVQVEIRFFSWLKGEAEVFDLVSLIHNNFRYALIESIKESAIIEDIILISAGPAPVQFEFPPPSKKHCVAMINGTPVPGRGEYFPQLTDSVVDVSTHDHWEDSVDNILVEVRNAWLTLVLPSLAGCMDTVDETWRNSTKTPQRYSIFDAALLNVTHVPGDCTDGFPRPCLRVGIRTQRWLKKEIDFSNFTKIINQNYGPALIAKVGDRTNTSAIIKQAATVSMWPVFR